MTDHPIQGGGSHHTQGDPVEVDARAVLEGAHPHGYLLLGTGAVPAAEERSSSKASDSYRTPSDVQGWRVERDLIPGMALHLHPRTVLSHTLGATGTIVLLGHPVDVALGSTDGHRIAGRLASAWDLLGEERMVREAAQLGGRWTLLAASHPGSVPAHPAARLSPHTNLLVVPDTHASQPVFYAVRGEQFALASTPALVAQALDLPVDPETMRLRKELKARRGGATTYLPGRRTTYVGLAPLMPNCLLRVDLSRRIPQVGHERFWPWREREESSDVDAVYADFRERLSAHSNLLASLGRPAVSLTAGLDSRVTLALSRASLQARNGLTFTYIHPPDARKGPATLADVTGASAVAAQTGLPHRVLRWRHPPDGSAFDVLHRRTYAPLRPSRGAAHAMWADLPRDLVQLQSNCAETGTTFVRHRTAEPLSPRRLAQMMLTTDAEHGLEDLAETMFGGYLDYADMTPNRLLGYDHHDIFYWEQRMGRWGWQKFTDGDFGHRILLPFNDRVLLETMLTLPYPRREARELLERVVAEEPAARLPRRPTGSGQVVTQTIAARLPGRLGQRIGRRVGRMESDRARRLAEERLTWAKGYAVLPTGPAALPASWVQVPLPGGHSILHKHPSLPHAVVGSTDTWVLALGEPVDLTVGIDGTLAVAAQLHKTLREPQLGKMEPAAPAVGVARVESAVAALAGGWVVVMQTPGRALVLTDPLVSLGLHLTPDARGMVSHLSLTGTNGGTELGGFRPGAGPPLTHGNELLLAPGPVGVSHLSRSSLTGIIDLAEMAEAAARTGWSRESRLKRHVELLLRRGPAWLALDAGEPSAQLLALVARPPRSAHALTWWDRKADDCAAEHVFAASARAAEAGVPHRVVGLREDVDGSDGEPGRSARRLAAEALAVTWSHEPVLRPDTLSHGAAASPATSAGSVALSDAVDEILPPTGVLWVGAVPPAPRPGALAPRVEPRGPRTGDLIQGVRRIALPFSDRLLPLLPA